MRTRVLSAVALCASILVSSATPPAAADPLVTSRSGQQILVNGQVTSFRGFNYIAAPVGAGPFMPGLGASSVATCANDAAMMRNAGVNLVRVWWSQADTASSDLVRRCFDAMDAVGIGVAITLQVGGSYDRLLEAGNRQQFVAAMWEQWRPTIDALLDHPAVRFWLLGNEMEIALNATGQATWFGAARAALEDLAALTKARDPNHLVGSTLSALNCYGQMDSLSTRHAAVPSLDLWTLNLYHSPPSQFLSGWPCLPSAYAGLYDFLASYEPDPRPVFITEFGTDRFSCHNPTTPVTPPPVTPDRRDCAGTSAEDSAAQAQYFQTYLAELDSHVTTSATPGPLSGALAFMYSDVWSGEALMPFATHDIVGHPKPQSTSGFADGVLNNEWWGVTQAQAPGVQTRRVASPALDALAAIWTGVARPSLSAITTSVLLGCRVTLHFTTNEPTVAVVNASSRNRVNDGLAHVVSESPLFVQVYDGTGSTPSTTHSIDVTLAAQVPLEPWLIAVRAVTSDGRQANADPIGITCT